MLWVQICVDLENEARQLFLLGRDFPFIRVLGSWGGSEGNEAIQEFSDAEVIKGRPEQDRCYASRKIVVYREWWVHTVQESDIFPEFCR
ncbi:hypothetical protein MASR2M78_21700 [Treponema sp.]